MILGANVRAVGAHLASWRHPSSWTNSVMRRENAVKAAQIAERGKFHFLFLADNNSVKSAKNPRILATGAPTDRPAVFDPVTLLAGLAMVTERIGLVATSTTTYDTPFSLARRFGSLDHLSHGRAGWNLVTSSQADDAYNFGDVEHPDRDARYPKASEFAEVVKGLWDSWADDAFLERKDTGAFLDPEKMHVLNHRGTHFSARGPLNLARPPQGYPVIFSAGQSELGLDLIARTADCTFAAVQSLETGKALRKEMTARLEKYGRPGNSLKILLDTTVYVGRTRDEAQQTLNELGNLIPEDLGVMNLSKVLEMDLSGYPVDGPVPIPTSDRLGGTAIRSVVAETAHRENLTIRQTYQRVLTGSNGNSFFGDYKEVADQLEHWWREEACDGFVIGPGVMPKGLEDFVDLVIPELQKRGAFHKDYTGSTLRENLGLERPKNQFFASK